MSFIKDDFLLKTNTSKWIFHEYAENLPILDYHCHLNPQHIAENKRFENIGELFLSADHYKWRIMRSNGVDEKFITGNASYYDKFLKFASCLPYCAGNPMLHWTGMELKNYFGVDEPLTLKSAPEIWDRCNEIIQSDDFCVQSLIKKSNVEVICTTDDPKDSLEYHKQISKSDFPVKVLPTFRPDKVVDIENEGFVDYICNTGVNSYNDLTDWIVERIKYFNSNGCKLSDHSLGIVPYRNGNPETVFKKRISGRELTTEEIEVFKTSVLNVCAREYTNFNWTMQLHIGALRNNNTEMYKLLGADVGFDSINDRCVAEKLSLLLNSFELENNLPKTILYNLNPKDNYVIGTMIGNFQKSPIPSKLQFGSGWWFNDQKDGIEAQLRTLGNLGVLGRFVGMLTDSRSFISYSRHEYFRRVLCNLIGSWVEEGSYPANEEMLKELIEGISYYNAKKYFDFK